ncbi:MAG: hypothetical protein KME35_18450 [Aphanocapsa sp. GSE-SYN-MK-11-07L]|nr:hypothetical protein [Aphanocapsa sp. GSE-SYN-MK-11-07L]
MRTIFKISALFSILMLALATQAKAETLSQNSVRFTRSTAPIMLAQAHVPSDDFYDLSEIFMANVKMVQMGKEAMKSSDPEIKKMGEEMMVTGNANLQKLMPMLAKHFRTTSPR